MNKILIPLAILLIFFLAIQSCGKKNTAQPDHSILITSDTVHVTEGNTRQLSSKNYAASDLTWTSSDSTIAAVDANGLIAAYKTGVAVINIESKKYNTSTTCSVTVSDAKVVDVGAGADGSVFVVGADSVSGGGHSVFKIISGQFHKLPAANAERISVFPDGKPWIVTYNHQIYKYDGSNWVLVAGLATDIAIGPDGSVYAIGTQIASVSGGNAILKLQGTTWVTMPDCAGIHIAVGPNGLPWVVNLAKSVFSYGGTYLWNAVDGVNANDIGIGANGDVYVSGYPNANGSLTSVYHLQNSFNWVPLPNVTATSVSVGPKGTLWWIDANGILHNQ